MTDSFPEGKRRTGRPAKGGPIVTGGGADDQRFRAFDTKTGKELWTYKLDYSVHAIVATGGSYLLDPDGGDSLIAFALPK